MWAARNSADNDKLADDYNKLLQKGKDTLKLLRNMSFRIKIKAKKPLLKKSHK